MQRMGKGFRSAAALAAMVAAAMMASRAAASAAPLEPGKGRGIGGGYQVAWTAKELRVKKGGRSAPLEIAGKVPDPTEALVDVATAGDTLVLTASGIGCEQVERYSRAQLEARLDAAEGASLLRRGKQAEAEARFAHALALDGDHAAARRGLAQVQLARGAADQAAAVLGTSANPLREYLYAAADPGLQALTGLAQLGQRRAARPGTAQLDGAALTLPAPGMARDRFGALVTVETSVGHGLCAYTTRLVFRGGADLAVLAALPLVEPRDYTEDDCAEGKPPSRSRRGRAKVAERVAFANRMLAELGFHPLAGKSQVASVGQAPSGARTGHFGDVGLVVGDDGSARYFQKQRMLAEYGAGSVAPGRLTWALLSELEHRVFVETKQIGCYREEQVSLGALPLPPPPPAS